MEKTEYYKCGKPGNKDFKFSIIVPTWNNLDYLKLCIGSIKKNSRFNHQIIVLINEGKDGTLKWLENQPDIDYIHLMRNMGICFGLNICRSLVKTDYIVYLNDDMYVCPDWDLEFDNEIKKIGHNYFFLSATMIEPHDTGNACVIVKNYGEGIGSFNEKLLLQEYGQPTKADWSGSTWPPNIVHLDLWDIVGGLSIEFSPGFYSDPDFSKKLWDIGVRYFKGIAASRVYHFGSKSTKRFGARYKGRDKFIMKWGISSNYFTNNYLKKGQRFRGELPSPRKTKTNILLNKLKTFTAALKRKSVY